MTDPINPGPRQREHDAAIEAIKRQGEDFDRHQEQFQQRLKAMEEERRLRERKEGWLWLPFTVILICGICIASFLEHRRKKRRQAIMELARTIVELIWEEEDEKAIWSAINHLQLNQKEAAFFVQAMNLQTIGLPIPWYRSDITAMLSKIKDHLSNCPRRAT